MNSVSGLIEDKTPLPSPDYKTKHKIWTPYDDETWFALIVARKLWKLIDDPIERRLWRFSSNPGKGYRIFWPSSPESATDEFTRDKPFAELESLRRQFPFGKIRHRKHPTPPGRRRLPPRNWYYPPTPPGEHELIALGLGDRYVGPREWMDMQEAALGPFPADPPAGWYANEKPTADVAESEGVKEASPSTRKTRTRTGTRNRIQHSEAPPNFVDDDDDDDDNYNNNNKAQQADSAGSKESPASHVGSPPISLRRSERIKHLARCRVENGRGKELDSSKKLSTQRTRRRGSARRSTQRAKRRRT